MRRSLEHIRTMEELPKDDFSFIMDEIFGTNPNEGIADVYAIAID